MIQITPNNKKITDKKRAEIRGELVKSVVFEKIVHSGYHNLTVIEEEFAKDILAKDSIVTEEQILEHCKTIKIEYFNKLCEQKIIEGFVASNGYKYRTNRDDQTNMIGQKDELNADDSITTVSWKTEDYGYVNHTRAEWLNVYNEAFTHKKTQLFKYNQLKISVLNSISHEEMEQIKWL